MNSEYICEYLVVFLFIVIMVWLIVGSIIEKKKDENVKDYLKKIHYLKVTKNSFLNLFGSREIYRKIEVSRQIASNFKSVKTVDYLCKYFGLVINDESLENLQNYINVRKKAEDFCIQNNYSVSRLDKYTPEFVMIYTSPAGRSSLTSEYVFNAKKTGELYNVVLAKIKQQSTKKMQRSKMTSELRESILRRDNWTCQKCGNSVYNEPNLLLEVDHIIPIARGGKTEPKNLQTLCWKCNRNKSDKLVTVPKTVQ